jgi:hypothetical protein
MINNYYWRYTLIILLVMLGSLTNADAKSRIVPFHSEVTFSTLSTKNNWSIPIKFKDGYAAYVLSLEPQFDVGHHIIVLELRLRNPKNKISTQNLLEPEGRWHGLQAYDFAAYDLAKGVKESAFGEKRTLFLKKLGLKITVIILDAVVSEFSTDNYQIDTLKLQIEVDNVH